VLGAAIAVSSRWTSRAASLSRLAATAAASETTTSYRIEVLQNGIHLGAAGPDHACMIALRHEHGRARVIAELHARRMADQATHDPLSKGQHGVVGDRVDDELQPPREQAAHPPP